MTQTKQRQPSVDSVVACWHVMVPPSLSVAHGRFTRGMGARQISLAHSVSKKAVVRRLCARLVLCKECWCMHTGALKAGSLLHPCWGLEGNKLWLMLA